MLGPTFSALTGLNNASKRLQNSANNLSNVQTVGFKKGEINSVENKTGGTRVNSISKVNTQGGLIPTNNPLDLAIEGKGSNVDIAEEMVDQIVAKAAFKANFNIIKANDEMIGSLLDIKS
ncbi:flagellar basal body rod C-terminal domain-containing protein [Nitrospinaceae bacterium]|nr:flagellar basal body rod C-terminal domain-containing protein [Nitrospinaceae bacterium]